MVVWKKVSDTVGEGHLQEQQKEAWNIPPGWEWGESLSPQSFAVEGSRGVVGGGPPSPRMMIKRTFGFGFPQSVTHADDLPG